ncbi:hypothetical protein FRC02_009816 [Tulasnella sp. 418]|nr:hypothetical protein FRC02_009816 [Tulasnella sp. 418]
MPILLAEVNQLLSDLSNQPENFMEMIQRTVLSLSFSIIFGQRIPDIKSSDAQDFLRASDETFELSAPGEYPPVDLLPILHYIPDRFANNWKSRCDVVKEENEVLWFKLVDNAQKRLKRGTPNGCLTESLLNRAEEWDLNPKTVAYMGGNFLGAATHTTNAALDWFVLLAAIHQGAQEKMREEIDRVIGPDRFPDAKDLPNLPYLRAFLREVRMFRSNLYQSSLIFSRFCGLGPCSQSVSLIAPTRSKFTRGISSLKTAPSLSTRGLPFIIPIYLKIQKCSIQNDFLGWMQVRTLGRNWRHYPLEWEGEYVLGCIWPIGCWS